MSDYEPYSVEESVLESNKKLKDPTLVYVLMYKQDQNDSSSKSNVRLDNHSFLKYDEATTYLEEQGFERWRSSDEQVHAYMHSERKQKVYILETILTANEIDYNPKRLPITRQELGYRIKNLRYDVGLTQKELAQKLSVSISAVSGWENGRSLPTKLNLEMILAIGHVSVDTFLSKQESVE